MKIYPTLLMLAAGCSMAYADAITEQQALANACMFIEQSGPQTSMRRVAGKKPVLTKALEGRGFYAFNINGDAGYIVTSGSDRTQAVLGYSDHGSLNPDNMPEPLKYWLESLDKAVESIEAGIPQKKVLTANNVARVADKTAIAPLVTCKWNQGDPFNIMTPSYVDQNTGATYAHSATGCVATATTQIMYYWKWPQDACAAIPSYTYNWSGNVRTTEALPPVVFDWDNMTDTYDSRSSQKSKEAVAQLMLYAGHGMQSGYAGATGATSYNALNALKNYFGYNRDAYIADQLNYTYQEWEDLFYNELSAGRPLLMGADNYERTGGHEFVADGYDGNGLFHINWGWGGWDDGYFVLTVMAPDNQGIGGSTDANGYSMGQNVCINLWPANVAPSQETVRASISNISAGQSKIRKNSDGVFSLSFTYDLRTLLMNQYTVEHAFRLTADDNTIVDDAISAAKYVMYPSYRYNFNASIKLQNLADGTYKLSGISRLADSQEWLADDHSDRNYIQLVVSGDEMTVEVKPGMGSKLVVNSLNLEGATEVGQWQKVVYNITNNGNDFYGETYLFVDGKLSSGNTISIPAGATADIYYKFQPVNNLGVHNFLLSSSTNVSASSTISDIDRMFNLDCMWKADGTMMALPKIGTSSYEVPADIAALYLYGSSPRSIAVSSANPNLVLYYDENVKISNRMETIMRKYITNIVIGGKAVEAGFKDGYNVYIPMAFTAQTASYTRENMPTWSTLALPFDVDRIDIEGVQVDWFTSKDDLDKKIFVKRFAGNRAAQLRFSHTSEIKANTPYFVGLAGNLNGSSFDHTGKNVTFSGSNVLVEISGEHTDNFVPKNVKMLPCYSTGSKDKMFGIDENLENFVPVDKLEPFHAYVNTTSSATSYSIYYDEGEGQSGVEDVAVDIEGISPQAPVYNLQGVPTGTYADFDSLRPGLYIVAGRKIFKNQ